MKVILSNTVSSFFSDQLVGLVGVGEEVTLIREHNSQYDKNAIQVLNISGEKVGHIPRNVAGKLAPLIDSNRVVVEGALSILSCKFP